MSKQPDHGGARPVVIHAYLQCPNCGRIPKPTTTILALPGAAERVHCHLTCDRCGSEQAILYLERESRSVN